MNCCTRKPLLTVSARIMLIYKQLSRSVNYLSQSCQLSSIQPIRSWYQELVSWNGGINGMSTGSPVHFIPFALDCTRLSPTGACSQASLSLAFIVAVYMRKVLARPWVGVRVCHLLLLWLCACVRCWPDRGLVFECVTCFYWLPLLLRDNSTWLQTVPLS